MAGARWCNDGMMDRFGIDEVYGMHNMPGIPIGTFAIRPGAMMAAADQFEVVVTGKGGHAAKPHECIDTTLVASHMVVALQSIASRNVDPLKQVVVSVCTFRTESEAFNVIPQTVTLRATVRTLDPDVQDFVEARIKAIVKGTAETFGASAEIDYKRGYPVTMNAPENTDYAAAGGAEGGGEGRYRAGADDGGRGFLLHAERAARGLYLRRQRRHGDGASPGL